jgi:RNA polymerase sigma-70 factor, ECF subfamily
VNTGNDDLATLLSRTALGDRASFARIYELTHTHLFGLAQRMLVRRQWAEDVLQDAFISVWKNASGYNPQMSQPMTWLIAIVRNRALDALRAQGRRLDSVSTTVYDDQDAENPVVTDIADHEADPLTLLSSACDTQQIRGCMDSLDARVRQSLALAYYNGMSNSEVAAHLSSPLGSVKTWIRKGLMQLKACVESARGNPAAGGAVK